VPLNGKYLYKYDLSESVPVIRGNTKDIYAVDHVNNKTYIAINTFMLEISIGVNKGTIGKYLREGNHRTLAGYSFRYLDDQNPEIPNITKELALCERELYFSKKPKFSNSINVNY